MFSIVSRWVTYDLLDQNIRSPKQSEAARPGISPSGTVGRHLWLRQCLDWKILPIWRQPIENNYSRSPIHATCFETVLKWWSWDYRWLLTIPAQNALKHKASEGLHAVQMKFIILVFFLPNLQATTSNNKQTPFWLKFFHSKPWTQLGKVCHDPSVSLFEKAGLEW